MSFEENNIVFSTNEKVHFTYKRNMDKESLCQGDVLKITPEITEIIQRIHPYFAKEQYKYFIVLTQSCDLVRRGEKGCKTPYITLAVVRSYDDFLEKTFSANKLMERVEGFSLMDAKSKEKAYQIVERIYNNTESEYFFLYKEDLLDFPESMVAYLKISVAIKSDEHYDTCLRAKVLELSDEFKAKIGWLIGDMYSRVGTVDWEGVLTARDRKAMLNGDLTRRFIIGSKEQLGELKKHIDEHEGEIHNHEEAMAYLSQIKIESKYDKVMGILEETVQSVKGIPIDEKAKLIKSIRSKNMLKSLIT